MTTLLLSHETFADHAPPEGHPERPDRIRVVNELLERDEFSALKREQAPIGNRADVLRAHPEDYVEMIEQASPEECLVQLDGDTYMGPQSLKVTMRGIGAMTRAIDEVVTGNVHNAFCAVRPPGHHAEKTRPMGFCIYNIVAIAAHYARAQHGLERVAVVDFDVHHGNGTQDIFWHTRDLMYASTHQMPLFPGTGAPGETGVGNIHNAPLSSGADGEDFKHALQQVVFPALDDFRPDLILVSAGFDAHRNDPLAGLNLVEEDFGWATLKLMDYADKYCAGRLVSVLEGGYDLDGLTGSVAAHVTALMQAG
jgi:acetoin utilization deacetylase AcuC-like enzyme